MRLLANGSATYSLAMGVIATLTMAAVLGYAFAPLSAVAAWLGAAAGLAGSSLFAAPFVVWRVRWAIRLARDGVIVEGTHDGWGDAWPRWLAVVEPTVALTCPRYRYTYAGVAYQTLWLRYLPVERAAVHVALIVDPDRPDTALVLRGIGEERIEETRVSWPRLSTHIVPWIAGRGSSAKGCGCAFLIFLLALGLTGSYGWARSSTEGVLFDALVVIGLGAPIVAIVHAILRAGSRG